MASEEESKANPEILTPEDYEKLLAELKELKEKKDQLLRAAADFENAKKRLARERDEYLKFGQERLLRELLPVFDNFQRALGHAEPLQESQQKELQGLIAGIEMTYKQIYDILKGHGLKRFESLGKPYDPHLHEIIGHVEEEGEEDQIVEEVEPGYTLHDRLLRAAKVRVRVPPKKKD